MSFQVPVVYPEALPTVEELAQVLGFQPSTMFVLYDRELLKRKFFKSWLKNFSTSMAVTAGERLKDVDYFPRYFHRVMKVLGPAAPRSGTCLIAVGGGSVGDFAGFLASVFKRGIPIVHIPSTLLAAIDSAHGGKNALNYRGFKNQIGTFYPSAGVFIVKELLEKLPDVQIRAAAGELCKAAIISGGSFFDDLDGSKLDGFALLWDFLPQAIAAKMKIVLQDPTEITGKRQVLNLGHSLGHCLESYFQIPHGEAIAFGTVFALEWSRHRGYLTAEKTARGVRLVIDKAGLVNQDDFFKARRRMPRSRLRRLILGDKKMRDLKSLNFIFVEDLGRAFPKEVTLDSFLTEAQRQGWMQI
jgi:3-dehydroquinate synthase